MLSTINPLTLAWQGFVGTALGAAMGALIASFIRPNWMVYGIGVFVWGILGAVLRLGSAYRFAAITLSIVLLIAQERPPWIVASHRFVEVSLGIAVALMTTLVWPPSKNSLVGHPANQVKHFAMLKNVAAKKIQPRFLRAPALSFSHLPESTKCRDWQATCLGCTAWCR